MRLLLDTQHSRHAAERLRSLGYDVLAASDDTALAALADDALLRAAASDQRAVVTENVKDFDAIARAWSSTGDHLAGLVFTSPRRFHRGSASYPENLVRSLGRLLDAPPLGAVEDWIHWLE